VKCYNLHVVQGCRVTQGEVLQCCVCWSVVLSREVRNCKIAERGGGRGGGGGPDAKTTGGRAAGANRVDDVVEGSLRSERSVKQERGGEGAGGGGGDVG
jgi:hypothetical protein